MMKEVLFNLIRKSHYNVSIYTAEIFERRCQEEIIRSDEDHSSFVYLEFGFESIKSLLQSEEENETFWNIFLDAFVKNGRGCDLIGFLEHDTGIGLLLLDSRLEGWNRVKGRFEQAAIAYNFDKMPSVLDSIVKPIVYPTSIEEA